MLTPHRAKYIAHDLTLKHAGGGIDRLSQALKNTKEQIKVAQREARQATTLDEQQDLQEKIARLERQQRKQRQEIFQIEDEINEKRDQLIDQITQRMTQKVVSETIFTIAWSVN